MRSIARAWILTWPLAACALSQSDAGSYSRCFADASRCDDAGVAARDSGAHSGAHDDADAGDDVAASGRGGGGGRAGAAAGAGGFGGLGGHGDGSGAGRGGAGGSSLPAAGASGGAASELPRDPALWLSADEGITANASGAVTRWADRSGHARDATAKTATAAPRLDHNAAGQPVLFFDGNDSELTLPAFPALGELSFFAVVNAWSVTSCRSILHLYTPESTNVAAQLDDIELGVHDSQWYYEAGRDFVPRNTLPTALPEMTPLMLSVVHAAATSVASARVNGAVSQSRAIPLPASVARSSVTIGYNNYYLDANTPECGHWFGQVAEVLLYARALSDVERGKVEAYLAAKWGIVMQ